MPRYALLELIRNIKIMLQNPEYCKEFEKWKKARHDSQLKEEQS